MKRRILNILVALNQFVFSLITLGGSRPDETMSAAAWRLEQENRWQGKVFRPFIDFLFLPLEKDHCYKAYLSELRRLQG